MHILYAIQSTGNGHLSRAMELLPYLKRKGTVDILVSGPDFRIDFPYYINYRLKGFGFTFGKSGGIDFFDTCRKSNLLALLRDIKNIPVEKYDLVISDFEPVSAWACHIKKIPCVALSNQSALLSKKAPKPKQIDLPGKLILQYYAPTSVQFGIHYRAFDKNIFTPIIRKEIRQSESTEKNYYTVYLPAYEDEKVKKHLNKFKDVRWEVFSKEVKTRKTEKNVSLFPIESKTFQKSVVNCKGIITAAGFGTTTEALFLQKKLLVIPQKSQFEQQYNGAMLKEMGVTVVKKLKKKHHEKIEEWLHAGKPVEVNYADNAKEIIDEVTSGNYKPAYLQLPENFPALAV